MEKRVRTGWTTSQFNRQKPKQKQRRTAQKKDLKKESRGLPPEVDCGTQPLVARLGAELGAEERCIDASLR